MSLLFKQDFKMPSRVRVYVKKPLPIKAMKIDSEFKVETLEGVMTGQPGDYLICGIRGEFYPCKKEIFEQSYEEIRIG